MNIKDIEIVGLGLDKILLTIIIAIAAVTLGKIMSLYLTQKLKKVMTQDHVKILTKAIYFLLFFIAVLIILPIIGFDPSSIALAGGIIAIIIGFATQSIFGNLVSGIFLIFERPIKLGDVIKVDDTYGMVEDIKVISTTVRTFDGYFVRIPNMTVFNTKIVNYFVNKARRFEYTIGIRYRDDAEKAIEVIRDTIEKHPFALKYPEPLIFVDELGDSSVEIVVKIWAPFTEWYDVRMELLWKIKKDLEKNGIHVPFPQREVWFNNELSTRRSENEK
ncbi:MAG: mechanosensitive ion channel family protein [Thermoplasmatota archaeon]